jgi:hypothetical protein
MDTERKRADLNPKLFADWLLAHEEGASVGITVRAGECPLSNHLSDQTGRHIHISQGSYGAGEHEGETPLWAREFITRIDTDLKEPHTPVTREVALEYLARVCPPLAAYIESKGG